MKVFEYDDTVVNLGQNALENTQLVGESNPNHVWVHLESFPSGHVIIQCEEPSNEVLTYAMNICLEGTRQKNMKNVKASVTKVSNLILTDTPGEVIFKSNRKVKSIKIS